MHVGKPERGQQKLSRWSRPGACGRRRDTKEAGLVQSGEEEAWSQPRSNLQLPEGACRDNGATRISVVLNDPARCRSHALCFGTFRPSLSNKSPQGQGASSHGGFQVPPRPPHVVWPTADSTPAWVWAPPEVPLANPPVILGTFSLSALVSEWKTEWQYCPRLPVDFFKILYLGLFRNSTVQGGGASDVKQINGCISLPWSAHISLDTCY